MFEPHPNNPPRRAAEGLLNLARDGLPNVAANPLSLDQRLIRRSLIDLGKQPDAHAGKLGAEPTARCSTGSKVSSMQMVLELLGHSPSCARLARAGLLTSCRCQLKPADDPTVVIGLAVHFARSAMAHRVPLPASVVERLTQAAEAGDPACRSVAEWLADLGLLGTKPHWSAGMDDR